MSAVLAPFCAKVGYASRREALAHVATHDVWEPSCHRCAAGFEFRAYRCEDGPSPHHHVGHGWPEGGDDMVAAPLTDLGSSAPLRGGDKWIAVSAGGKGVPVEIVSVNEVNVYFRAYGRGADKSQKFKLPKDAFRIRYAPLRLADDRQKRLAREERTPELAIRLDGEPVAESLASGTPEAAPVETPAEKATVAPSPYEALRPKRTGGQPPKLTAEQAREIWQLYRDGISPKEIASTYPISAPTAINIGRGRDYAWATADLRAAETTTAAPEPPTQEEPVQIATPPTVIETTPVVNTPERLDEAREFRRELRARDLAVEMADALEVLVEYAGRPLPKFIQLDLAAIRALVEQARALP